MTDDDRFAHTFSRSRKNLHWPEVDTIIADMSARKYASVLDVGCGNGRFLEMAEKSGFQCEKYHGIDSSLGMIQEAKQLHPYQNFTVCSMEKIDECQDLL
jgi:trans-aconitate methyltransferase